MPRTTYSDFSLPNLSQDPDLEKRATPRRRGHPTKKKSKNIARPNRSKRRDSKGSRARMQRYKATYSPVHQVELSQEDSASFQSDCIDNRLL